MTESYVLLILVLERGKGVLDYLVVNEAFIMPVAFVIIDRLEIWAI
jgi:hypothetical protein